LDLIIFLQLEKTEDLGVEKQGMVNYDNNINWLGFDRFKCWRAPTTSSPPD